MKRWIAIAVLLLAGCGSLPPSAAPPSPSSSGLPQTAASSAAPSAAVGVDPCAVAVLHLGAFVNQVGGLLASLRPQVATPSFDAPTTAAEVARVSAALRSFAGVEDLAERCEPTARIGPRIAALRVAAKPALDASASAGVQDAESQRSAAASLFGLLPDVQAIGRDVGAAATSLGLDARIAAIPDASTRPLGSLQPFPTPTPVPVDAIAEPDSYGIAFFGPGTTVKSYGVTGSTPAAIIASIRARGPFDQWVHQRAEALTAAQASQHIELRPTADDCKVVATAQPPVGFTFTITLPRWAAPKQPDAATVTWWNAELARAATHEKHHVDLWRDAATRMSDAVTTSTCGNVYSQLNAIVRQTTRENCQFDLDEYGRELGLTLESCVNQ